MTALARLIAEKGTKQKDLAEIMGMGPNRIRQLKLGQLPMKVAEAVKFAEFFKVPIKEFLTDPSMERASAQEEARP